MSVRDDHKDERDVLAAEYVLGVLPAEARHAAAARIESDPEFAADVARWQNHFTDLNENYEPVAPPAHVLARIEERLFGRDAAPQGFFAGLWNSLALWRSLAVAAVMLLAVVGYIQFDAFEPDGQAGALVVALESADSPVRYVALYDAENARLRLNHVAGERANAHDFELWVIEGDNPPVSLGVVPHGARVALSVASGHQPLIHSGAVLAVSSEPLGGSPTGAPTGPVVAAGDLRDL
ncbi:anti-sigma factor [Breoghania sp. L-A4]|uniref:anti-sigma factor n=1 Tax=Breoghania sp. L-A4 TaxID=2304600 RepID=UPI0020C0A6DD|nr:anti-sigma factor [Breoghania sp. L-A4]